MFGLRKEEDKLIAYILANGKRYKNIGPLVAAVFFVAIGLHFLFSSHAATGTMSLEPENGTLSGNASKIADSAASGGNAVKFGQGTTPPPPVTPPPVAGGGPFIAYSITSFFRAPLPDTAPIDSQSAQGIAFAKAHNPNPFPTIRGVGGNGWGMGYAMGSCSDPIWKFPSNATLPTTVKFLATEGFHAPANFGSLLTSNGDNPIVVIDRCGSSVMPKGFTVWGANVAYSGTSRVLSTSPGTGGTIVGGAFQHDSNGLDHRLSQSDSNLNERSRGNIPDSMLIRDDLLQYALQGGNNGTLGHVTEMFWAGGTDSSAGHYPPMVSAEGNKTGWGPEGIRIRVKPTWTKPAGCSAVGAVLAKTLQKYGAYLGDNGSGNAGIKAQQGSTFPGLTVTAMKGCITWDDMEFVQRGWSPSW